MKNILLLSAFLFLSLSLFAQPVNDDCAGLIDLGNVPLCPSDIYTNVDATTSDIGNDNIPSCFNGGNVDRDVWFQFTTDGTITDYSITVTGVSDAMGSTPMVNPQFEIYRGEFCGFDELASLDVCATANNGDGFVTGSVLGLDPNEVYYLRVNDYTASATPNSGSFQFCITEFIPDVNICDGPGSTFCSGTLYDCGGPDNDYGLNDNFTYTVCPNEFHECILIDVVDFNIENNFDFLNIYAGDNTAAPVLAVLSGPGSGTDFQIQASSNCVTFEFTSDGFGTQPGFELDWLCVSFPCDGSSEDNVEVITSIPFSETESTCGEASTVGDSPCPDDDFLNGPDYFYTYDSPGDICVEISITNADFGTGVLVLDGPPSDPSTNCVAQGEGGVIPSANLETAGTYYIIVANAAGCTDFDINIVEADCNLSPALVDALCNPLNGCQEFDPNGEPLPSTFNLDIGFEDVPIVNGLNNGCYLGTGAGNFYWFTIQAQADGPFGFIVDGANAASDIDLSVWGPFSESEVCDSSAGVINFITNNQPIRSSWSGGAGPTGLVDIHPITGINVTDPFDCGSPATPGAGGDDFVSTIPALVDEVYVVLINDWGGQITDGVIEVDWSPSLPEVLEPDAIEIVGSDTTICIGESVPLEVNVGVNDIEWLNGGGTLSCTDCPDPIATPTETTIYEVAVNGVCISDTVLVKVAVFEVDAGPDFTVCLGEDVQFLAGSEFDDATYEWTGPNLGSLSCTDCPDPVLTTTTAGTFTYTVTLNGPNCTLTDVITVVVLSDPAPMFDMVADSVFLCNGEATDLGQASNPATFDYVWTSVPAGFSSTDPNPNVTPTETTTYYVAVNSTLCPVTSLDSVYVEVSELPVLDLASDTLVCQGEAVILGNTILESGVTYQWTPDNGLDFDTIPNPTATIMGTTTYTLTATAGACVSTESITVTSTVISVDILNPDSSLICKGEVVNLNATASPPGTTVTWTPDDGSLNMTSGLNVDAAPETATTYIASVNVPGCTRSDTVFIDVDSIPLNMAIMPADTTVCMGTLVVLQSPIYEQSFFPDIDHQWSPSVGFVSPDSLYNIVIQAEETTTYTRITTNGICTETETATITVEPTAVIEIIPSDTTVCEGETVQLLATSDDVTDYEWTPDDGSLSCLNCPNPVASLAGPGNYSFTAMGEFENCPTMATANIQVIAAPQLALTGISSYCPGAPPITLNSAGAGTNSVYNWSSAPLDSNLDTDATNPQVSPLTTTTYSVTLTNGVCDSVFGQVTIIVDEVAVLTVDPDIIICADEAPISLNASGGVNNDNYTWVDSDGNVTTGAVLDDVNNTGTYYVTYDDMCNPPVVDSVMVTVLSAFNLSILPDPNIVDTMFAEGQEVELMVVNNPPLSGANYEWSTGQSGATITTVVTEIPSVTYTVTVTTDDGCEAIVEVTYDVIPAEIEFPNAFTPNGDGISDYFNFYLQGGLEITEFKIYSRWGGLVYDNDTPTTGWDGKKGDEDMPADVYFYYAVIKRPSGEEILEKGDISLIR